MKKSCRKKILESWNPFFTISSLFSLMGRSGVTRLNCKWTELWFSMWKLIGTHSIIDISIKISNHRSSQLTGEILSKTSSSISHWARENARWKFTRTTRQWLCPPSPAEMPSILISTRRREKVNRPTLSETAYVWLQINLIRLQSLFIKTIRMCEMLSNRKVKFFIKTWNIVDFSLSSS